MVDQVQVSGGGNSCFGQEHRLGIRIARIGRAGLLDDVVPAVHLVVPGAAVPVVVAGEVEDAGASDVERDVEVVGLLVEEVRRVGGVVAADAVVGAAHVGAHADALVGPAVPLR